MYNGNNKRKEGSGCMSGRNREIMKNYSMAMYPSTNEEYIELKERLGLTHDEMIKLLVKEYKKSWEIERGDDAESI